MTQPPTPKPVLQVEPATKAGSAYTAVFVVDKNGQPLMPTSPKRARLLRQAKKAEVFCQNPFTIRLLEREGGDLQPLELKFDPGSKTTGIALVAKGELRGWFCLAAWELTHRSQQIVDALLSRAQSRRGRRARKTCYRKPRFSNRTKPTGWLPPSLKSRVDNTVGFARKIKRVAPLTGFATEDACFDTQLMANPEVSGVAYQQGALAGYEAKEYLLIKGHHQCAYCKVRGVPLQIDHIVPKSRGGTDRISNLCLACEACNQKKANRPVEEFLKNKPDLLISILAQAKLPLKDAAAMNSTRRALVKALKSLNLPVSTGTGGRTKYNRTQQGYAKAHWLDAACVGEAGSRVDISRIDRVTMIHAKGRGDRRMCKSDKYGFPRSSAKTVKRLHGFQTGDWVRLVQPRGKHKGVHEGTVAIRATGRFDIKTENKTTISAPYTRFSRLSRFDGYIYSHKATGGIMPDRTISQPPTSLSFPMVGWSRS